MEKEKRKILHEIFEASVFLKGIEGILEIISGAVLTYTAKTHQFLQIVLKITEHERAQDPGDFLANKIVSIAEKIAPKIGWEIWYLLIHGAIKIFLSAMLMKEKIWAFPLGIYIYSTLAILLMVEFFRSGSMIYLGLSVWELLVVTFTVIDYRMVLAKKKKIQV